MKKDSFHLLKLLLLNNNVFLDNNALKLYYQSHPDYPSLFSMSDTLTHFDIENLALKIDKQNYKELPSSFIAHIKDGNENEFVYIRKKGPQEVSITYPNTSKKNISLNDFFNIWEGIVLVIDKVELGLSQQLQFNNQVLLPTFFATILLTALCWFYQNSVVLNILFIFLNLIGGYISILLIKEGLGISSPNIAKICNASSNRSCTDVLNSEGAKIWKDFTLSDACIIYFSTLLFTSILNLSSHFPLGILILVTTSAVLFTLYSLYYQAIILKKWCTLCLGITLIIWSQFFLILSFSDFILPSINWSSLLTFLFSLSVSFPLWTMLKPMAKHYQKLLDSKIKSQTFKKQYHIFSAALSSNPRIQHNASMLKGITLGSTDAPVTLTIALSTSCNFCFELYKNIKELLKKYPQTLKMQLLFNMNPDNVNNPFTKIALKILDLHLHQRKIIMMEAMDNWFIDKMNIKEWEDKWIIDKPITPHVNNILKNNFEWCSQNELNFTPVILLKEHLFPQEYELTDIEFFIDDLSASIHNIYIS